MKSSLKRFAAFLLAFSAFGVHQAHSSVFIEINNSSLVIATYPIIYGDVVIIAAEENVKYELIDDVSGYAPENIIVQRVDDDLHILLEDGDDLVDVIIEDYYDESLSGADSQIVGRHENGKIYAYTPASTHAADSISALADDAIAPQTLSERSFSTL